MQLIPAILLVSTLAAATPEPPKAEQSPVGIWMLKSVSVAGKPATAKELSGLLTRFGGLDADDAPVAWKFRKAGEDGLICRLNRDKEFGYRFSAETRELFLGGEDSGGEFSQVFDVRFTDKGMTLRFRDNGKAVVLHFVPDDGA